MNDIHYNLVEDYYFPTCTLSDSSPDIGRWADLYKHWLQETHPDEYTKLIWSNELLPLLKHVQQQACERLDMLTREIANSEDVTEQFKSENQLKWLRKMNNIRSRA